MNLDQAQRLISQLGSELGGDASSYSLDEHGEVSLVFEADMPVSIRFHADTLILASVIATDVNLDEPGLFATLMDYQFMGIRTYGAVMSWNPSTNCLLLSRQLYGEPSAEQLAHELSILLKTSVEVRDELEPLLTGEWSLKEDGNADAAAGAPALPGMLMNLA
jgi:hypothetical protein